MICPICRREMKKSVVKWDECEEYRVYDEKSIFCPCCGFTAVLDKEEIEPCTTTEGRD